MAINQTDDRLATVQNSGFSTAWDWKGSYMSNLADNGDLERFSQFSATPDSTAIFAGPARFNGLSGNASSLVPIGLVDNLQFSSNAQLARLYEIGSNRAYFTRGKTVSALSMTKVLCDQENILKALSSNTYRPEMLIDGQKAPAAESPNSNIALNLDSEFFAVPFGMLLLFKTRGGGDDGSGKILAGVYLENCMFESFSFAVANQMPVIQESISIQFDRPVPVSFN